MTGGQLTSPDRPGERPADTGGAGNHLAISKCDPECPSPADEPSVSGRIEVPERSDQADEPPVGGLERYLLDHADGSGPRPRTGTSVAIPVDESDCERARIALRRLSVDAPVARSIGVAAIALEISLERPLASARKRNRPLTLEFDVADCALMALALLYASRNGRREGYRRQARSLLDRVDRSTPGSVGVPSPDI